MMTEQTPDAEPGETDVYANIPDLVSSDSDDDDDEVRIRPQNSPLIDSACTGHLTNRPDLLKDVVECQTTFITASGEPMTSTHKGTMCINVDTPTGQHTIEFTDTLLFPKAAETLISLQLLDRAGCTSTIRHGKITVTKDGKFVCSATESGGLYRLEVPEWHSLLLNPRIQMWTLEPVA